jgi:hypothetical protein
MVTSVLLLALIGLSWSWAAAVCPCSARAGTRPDGYVSTARKDVPKSVWSFIALGDTQGIHGPVERKMWAQYLASGRRCPRQPGFCPAWRRQVYARAAEMLNRKRVSVAVHSGDLVHCGYCPPDWVLFRKIFWTRVKQKDRFRPAIGNHETPYVDPAWSTLSRTRPCLKGFHDVFRFLKMKTCRHYYWTTYGNAAFAFMCTGGGRKGWVQGRYLCRVSPPAEQTAWLRRVAAWVAARKRFDHLFVIWHIPPFTCSGNRITATARQYGRTVLDLARRHRRLRFTVLNGHQHVTEVFRIKGVLFMVNGGGGGPQRPSYRTCRCGPKLASRLIGPARYRWCYLKKAERVRPVTINFLELRVKGRRLQVFEHRLKDPWHPGLGFEVIPWGRL